MSGRRPSDALGSRSPARVGPRRRPVVRCGQVRRPGRAPVRPQRDGRLVTPLEAGPVATGVGGVRSLETVVSRFGRDSARVSGRVRTRDLE